MVEKTGNASVPANASRSTPRLLGENQAVSVEVVGQRLTKGGNPQYEEATKNPWAKGKGQAGIVIYGTAALVEALGRTKDTLPNRMRVTFEVLDD